MRGFTFDHTAIVRDVRKHQHFPKRSRLQIYPRIKIVCEDCFVNKLPIRHGVFCGSFVGTNDNLIKRGINDLRSKLFQLC